MNLSHLLKFLELNITREKSQVYCIISLIKILKLHWWPAVYSTWTVLVGALLENVVSICLDASIRSQPDTMVLSTVVIEFLVHLHHWTISTLWAGM